MAINIDGQRERSEHRRQLPSVDTVLRQASCQEAVRQFGHTATVNQIRKILDGVRGARRSGAKVCEVEPDGVATQTLQGLRQAAQPSLKRVFNLTGTVLHTNLGRALLPESAIAQATDAMRHPANLEYDLEAGRRGERDTHARNLICDLTGAEDALFVNNNAAAVVLVLNTLARDKEVVVSRGELIEIGGSFRMPDIMKQAGVRLVEVGTTNRTHLKDYEAAIGAETGLLMKVHTSNYLIKGFTKDVSGVQLAGLARASGIPMVDDLGSGTLIDLSGYGLERERTVTDALSDAADLVTFSGDKLLGGPQAGFIVGRRDLVQACAKNPLKRAMRLDKLRMAALEATLKLYQNPEQLAQSLPTLHMLSKPTSDIAAAAQRVLPQLQAALGKAYHVQAKEVHSQIGSGALPLATLPSYGLAIGAPSGKLGGKQLDDLARAFRDLPIPMIGYVHDGSLVFDLRTLEDEAAFTAQLDQVQPPELDNENRR